MSFQISYNRILAFAVTFMVGVGFFSILNLLYKEIPEVPPVKISEIENFQPTNVVYSKPLKVIKRKNCLPVDKNLKHKFIVKKKSENRTSAKLMSKDDRFIKKLQFEIDLLIKDLEKLKELKRNKSKLEYLKKYSDQINQTEVKIKKLNNILEKHKKLKNDNSVFHNLLYLEKCSII